MSKKKNRIESIYPLSPMQQGMLFHTLYDAGAGMYVVQTSITLHGDLQVPTFQRAWQQVIERHSVFRTAFIWEQHEEPFQVVYAHARLPWVEDNWRELSATEQQARIAAFLSKDREQGFVLSQAPLIRLTLFQLAAEVYHFIWSSHHLLIDGWSVPLVLNEVFAYYNAFVHDQELHLAPPRPYEDYIDWLQQQDLAKAEAFWRQALAGFRAPTPLGVDRPLDSSADVARYRAHEIQLTESTTAALHALARQQGLTLNTLVQGAWALLLSRYSGEEDIVFGATVAGRPPELAGVDILIGLFINTVPVRVQVPPEESLLTWLQYLQTQQAEARQYEYSSLVQIQGWSEVPRGQPLFESIVVFENYPVDSASAGPSDDPRLLIDDVQSVEQSNYALTMAALPGSTLELSISWDCRRFDTATVERLLGHLQTLLQGLVAQPELHLGGLPLLTEAERQQLIAWSTTSVDYPCEGCVHHLFEDQAARTPDAVALVFDETNDERRTTNDEDPAFSLHRSAFSVQHLTYAELNARANQLGHYLKGLGVGPEVRVGLCLERSPTLVIGLLGILKAGGAYVPLDPAYPPARLAFMLADAQAAVLLTQTARDDVRRPEGTRMDDGGRGQTDIVYLEDDWPAIACQPTHNLDGGARAENLAYVIYTSGSTGQPKGVLVEHRNLHNLLCASQAQFAFQPGDVLPWLAAAAFDISLFELLAPLLIGGVVHVLAGQDILDLPRLCVNLARWTAFHAVPSLMRQIVETSRAVGGAARYDHIRMVFVGGEAVPPGLLAEVQEVFRRATIYVLYGPTEATILCTCCCVPPGRRVTRVVIGTPLPNVQVRLYDRYQQLVPVGVAGEIYIGGAGVTRGYLNREELTEERYLRIDGQRWYRSGDWARYGVDGTLEFVGRRDEQVKVRGYRIELDEVAGALEQHPTVRAAVVVAREDTPDETRLVAYVVPAETLKDERRTMNEPERSSSSFIVHRSSLVSELRSFLAARLPAYMIPAAFVLLDALPLTGHGKVDRRTLPAPDTIRPTLDDPLMAPQTPIEEIVADIWADVLRLKRVGVHDNFFGLGGHSLLATRVIARVRTMFNIELSLRSLFESPTVAGLATQIATVQRHPQGLLPPPLRPAPRDKPPPLSFAQQRLWFLDQLDPDSPTYNISNALRLTGSLNIMALQQSLNAIVERHEALRTTFAIKAGAPVQVIAPGRSVLLPRIDIRGLPDGDREAVALSIATEESLRPFDLQRGPLLHITLLYLEADVHVLLLTMHHIIADGWSMGVFVWELATLYAAIATGTSAALPELPIQYADYAVWQRGWLRGEGEHTGSPLQAHLAYWQRQLADLPTLELPTDHVRPTIATFRGASHAFVLPTALHERLVAFSRREEVTLFMTLLAAFQVLLARYSRQEDIVVGTPIANRTHGETEGLIGCFINILVLRTDLAGNPTAGALLGRVREICLGAYVHQDFPFEQVVDALQPARDLSRHPLFQVMFVLQNAPIAAPELPGLTVHSLDIASTTTRFDLNLSFTETEAGLVGLLEYAIDLFDTAMIERVPGHFKTLLEGIVADPELHLADLALLTEAERQQLIAWNTTMVAYPSDRCVHHLFEDQVARTPDAVALVFDETNDERPTTNDEDPAFSLHRSVFSVQHLTYAELNRRANQLAYALRELGVGPEVRVGLCLERSPLLLIGLLGALKAGGAYVPLDPAYPPARLAFMLANAQVSVLLTTTDHRPPTTDHRPTIPEDQDVTLSPCHLVSLSQRAVVDLHADWPAIARQPTHNLDDGARAENLAYVIYTSGSTGTPKGVLVTHANLARLFTATRGWFHFDDRDVWTLFHSAAFDFSVWEVWGALCYGGRLVVVPYWVSRSPEAFYELLRAEQVTILNQTPLAFRQLIRAEEEVGTAADLALRLVIFGGEALTFASLAPWVERHGEQIPRLVNMYGITETTVHVTYRPIGADDLAGESGSLIGTPILDLQTYLLDDQLRPVPIGVPGELYVGGAGVARGYLNRPDLTAERFVPNPFAELEARDWRLEAGRDSLASSLQPPASRLYKTGDLVRYRASGEFEYLGRIDQQVKVRGYRIELGEIESVLGQHPAVREAVVVAREDAPGDKRLVAYVVPAIEDRGLKIEDSNADAHEKLSSILYPLSSELRSFLSERLPSYMLPAAFVVLEALPLSRHGKVDRHALPLPDSVRPASDELLVAPQTPVEELLAGIWVDVLRLKRVGIHDNFFALGGDSILSIQIVARANRAGLRLTPKQLFQHQTIAMLATVVGTAPASAAEQGLVEGEVPLTPIQHWFFAQELPDPQHFNQSTLLEIRQPIDYALLMRALRHLLAHHDALRLRFIHTHSGWQQVSAGLEVRPVLTQIDFTMLPTARQGAAIAAAATGLQTSLDLATGPLIRVARFRLGASIPDRLLLVVHHLAIDVVSWGILLEDLQTAYAQLSRGEAVVLPPKTTSFRQWAERLTAYARSDQLRQELAYWLAALRCRVPPLPVDHIGGGNSVAAAREVTITLPADETHALLHVVPEVYHTQIAEVLLAALAQALAAWVGAGQVLIDLEGHGREDVFDDVDLSRTVGWFTALFPALLDLTGFEGPGAALKAIKEQLRRIPHRGLGYGVLRYLSAAEEVAAQMRTLPAAEVSFNYLGQIDHAMSETGLFRPAQESSGPEYSSRGTRSHLLEIVGLVGEGQLRMTWIYSEEIHRRTTIEWLAEAYLIALRDLIAHCQSPEAGGYTLSDFPLVQLEQDELDKALGMVEFEGE